MRYNIRILLQMTVMNHAKPQSGQLVPCGKIWSGSLTNINATHLIKVLGSYLVK
jgi:hypothetical protein